MPAYFVLNSNSSQGGRRESLQLWAPAESKTGLLDGAADLLESEPGAGEEAAAAAASALAAGTEVFSPGAPGT